ncbi:MAG: FAD-dependent oxidoreductase [Desulfurococcaceae archaeon]
MYEHPILTFHRGKKVVFYFEDTPVDAYEGESVAVALYAIGIDVYSWSSKLARPRGPFCMIGKCSSCFMVVNGVSNTKTCKLPVKEGLKVVRQKGWGEVKTISSEEKYVEKEEIETDVLVVGGGPAGLEAALTATSYGLNVVVVDEHFKLGGQLLKQTHKFFGNVELFGGMRGFQIAENYLKKLRNAPGIRILTETAVYGVFRGGVVGAVSENKHYVIKPRFLIAATGAQERFLEFPNNDLPGVIGAGGVQTIMNEFGVKPGEKALVVGSGNVGLIVSYQLLQAGVEVKAVVEILPEIGGWFVHAAKIRRYGIPILTRHTLRYVEGDTRVRKAVVAAVDEKFNYVPGTEKEFDADLVLLAIGLEPDTRLHAQAGAVMKYVPELGGIVPVRTRDLETTVVNMYVAGDSSGIEEATTAILEGRIAALSVASKSCDTSKASKALDEMEGILKFLWEEYRASPLLARARKGKETATVSREELRELRKTYPPPISFGDSV